MAMAPWMRVTPSLSPLPYRGGDEAEVGWACTMYDGPKCTVVRFLLHLLFSVFYFCFVKDTACIYLSYQKILQNMELGHINALQYLALP